MKPPTLSVVMCVYDRPISVLAATLASLKEQPYDQMVVVADRSPVAVRSLLDSYAGADKRTQVVEIVGTPGWRSPVMAWNAGFSAANGELLYMLSSEVIQSDGNIVAARDMLAMNNDVVFGKAECSCGPQGEEVNWNGSAPGNLLVDARHPRPLGFIMACRRLAMSKIGGFDENFSAGYWWDDSDLVRRLWDVTDRFVFTDDISGIHQHHERPVLETEVGQLGIARNRAYMMQKYGELQPEQTMAKRVLMRPDVTYWIKP